jgi:hypothetical protein
VARWLPEDVYELALETGSSPEKAWQAALAILSREGKVLENQMAETGEAVVRAIVGSGAWHVNPALVTVRVTSTADGMTRLEIRGIAKEGLVRQRAGKAAVNRIADLLARMVGCVPESSGPSGPGRKRPG